MPRTFRSVRYRAPRRSREPFIDPRRRTRSQTPEKSRRRLSETGSARPKNDNGFLFALATPSDLSRLSAVSQPAFWIMHTTTRGEHTNCVDNAIKQKELALRALCNTSQRIVCARTQYVSKGRFVGVLIGQNNRTYTETLERSRYGRDITLHYKNYLLISIRNFFLRVHISETSGASVVPCVFCKRPTDGNSRCRPQRSKCWKGSNGRVLFSYNHYSPSVKFVRWNLLFRLTKVKRCIKQDQVIRFS